jgi:GntR family transcriptional regulator/MocR family aminotransferase
MTTLRTNGMTSDFLISVRRRDARPLHQQIYDAFQRRILSGELRAGQLVPSTRELAHDLRISRLPVLNAYARLQAEGYVETRAGTGTFIAASLKTPSRTIVSAGSRRVSAHAEALPDYERPTWAARLGPFQVGQPDLDSFPIGVWSKVVARHARRLEVADLQYGDVQGLGELRDVIASYVRTSRGVRCEASQVLIVSGSQQALDLATRVLLDAGDNAWVEDPGYWLVRHALNASGCRAVPVAVDREGMSVSTAIKSGVKARAAFVTPAHQYPMGVTMSVARRLQLLEWAKRASGWIVEDDYDSEFRYDSMPIASLQGLDRDARVIYIGTFSKVMFPSLRLGYMVVPEDLVGRFLSMRLAMDLGPPLSTQAAMAAFIREGHFARHIRRMRNLYAERRQVLLDAIDRELRGVAHVTGDAAGMHLAVLLERGDDRKIAANAEEHGLLLSPLSDLYVAAPVRSGFVLGFGNTKTSQIKRAVRQLKELL